VRTIGLIFTFSGRAATSGHENLARLTVLRRQGNGFWVTTDSLKVEALKEAAAYNRRLKVIHTKETPAGPFGRWPENEVLFRCE
jgi:hypothetical protein